MSTGADEAPDEQEESTRAPSLAAMSAEAQGSNIPLGWKPSAAKPVPVVRCVQIKKDGKRCGNWSVRGATKCWKHMGNGGFKSPMEKAAAIVEAARMELVEASPEAVDTLKWLMAQGTADQIRLKAAEAVLDRVGIRGGIELDVTVDEKQDTAGEVRTRLDKLARGAIAAEKLRESLLAPPDEDEDEDVVDGEVIDDSDTAEQPDGAAPEDPAE